MSYLLILSQPAAVYIRKQGIQHPPPIGEKEMTELSGGIIYIPKLRMSLNWDIYSSQQPGGLRE
jgi:hypothetical protein